MADELTAGNGGESRGDGVVHRRAVRVTGAVLLLATVVALAVAGTAAGSAVATAGPASASQHLDDAASPSMAADGADANVTIASASANASAVGVGESVGVAVELRNDGTERGDYTARLTADGQYRTGVQVRLGAGANRTVRLVTRFDRPGSYRLAVNGHAVATVSVTANVSVRLTNVSVDPGQVERGVATAVSGRLHNEGAWATTENVTLAVDGQVVATRSVQLDPGESERVAVEHSFDRPGEYAVALDGQRAGTVLVTGDGGAHQGDGAGADDAGADDDSGDDSDYGSGLLMLAVGALVVVVVVGAVYAWIRGGGLADEDDGGTARPDRDDAGATVDGPGSGRAAGGALADAPTEAPAASASQFDGDGSSTATEPDPDDEPDAGDGSQTDEPGATDGSQSGDGSRTDGRSRTEDEPGDADEPYHDAPDWPDDADEQ